RAAAAAPRNAAPAPCREAWSSYRLGRKIASTSRMRRRVFGLGGASSGLSTVRRRPMSGMSECVAVVCFAIDFNDSAIVFIRPGIDVLETEYVLSLIVSAESVNLSQ